MPQIVIKKIQDVLFYELQFSSKSKVIISEIGCTLFGESIVGGQKVLDNPKTVKELQSNKSFKSSILLPFPNRINQGKYSFEGCEQNLRINEKSRNNALHGLVFNKKFDYQKSQITDTFISITFESKISKTEFAGYPFELKFQITFVLNENSLEIQIDTQNTGKTKAPFGVGWHPYFKFESKIDDLDMQIPSDKILQLDPKTLIPNGKIKKFNNQSTLIGSKIFDDCFVDLKAFETKIDNLIIYQSNNMKYLQIYTPPNRKSIAIEPMSCPPNSFNTQIEELTLKPKQKINHTFGVKII